MKAYYFLFITDRWGDVPYFDALKGSANFSPAFSPQKDIYNDQYTRVYWDGK